MSERGSAAASGGGAAASDGGLVELLGGRSGAVDASLPPAAFVLGWLLAGRSIEVGAAAAIGSAVLVAGWRLARGQKPRAVVISVAFVVIAALIALHTGRASDFFLLQLLSNVASALAWAASIVIRWPLLGVVAGLALGQKARWRRDPDLLRAYQLASLVWVFGQYTLRVLVYGALWLADETVALGVARVVLSWPLVALTLALSAVVLRRVLPDGHPGFRHPQVPDTATGDGGTARA